MSFQFCSLVGLWSVFFYKCYQQYTANFSSQTSLSSPSSSFHDEKRNSRLSFLQRLGWKGLFKRDAEQQVPEQDEENKSNNDQQEKEQNNGKMIRKSTMLRKNKKINNEKMKERRRRLRDYRRWFEKNRGRVNRNDWQSMYKQRINANIYKDKSTILSDISESDVEEIRSYDPFIN